MSMAENIRRLRIQHNMTQEELGSYLGVKKSAIRKYESGMVENIPRSSIQKMSEIFNVRPSYLMGWEEKPLDELVLTEGEQTLLALFRALPDDLQELYIETLRAWIKNQTKD